MTGGRIFLVTGPMAAGKSTVGRLLAARFDRGAFIEGDLFRQMLVSGRVDMTPSPSEQALQQLRLRYQLAAATADAFASAGFDVVVEDVVAGPLLSEFVGLIRSPSLEVVVLLPTAEALAAREKGRATTGYDSWPAEDFREGFATTTPKVGHWLDTSQQTPEETVDEILTRVG